MAEKGQTDGQEIEDHDGVLNPVVDTRMDKLPAAALLAVGRMMKHGMKYEKKIDDNWRRVPAAEHLNHGLRHVFQHMAGDRSEAHVEHAVTRFLMWGELCLTQ